MQLCGNQQLRALLKLHRRLRRKLTANHRYGVSQALPLREVLQLLQPLQPFGLRQWTTEPGHGSVLPGGRCAVTELLKLQIAPGMAWQHGPVFTGRELGLTEASTHTATRPPVPWNFFSRRFAVAMPAMPCCFSFFRCRFPDDLDERGTFQISLQRRAGQALGIMAAYCPDYDGLVIEGLTEESDTAIAQWNQEHPEAELLAGLAIMEVNGRRKGEEIMAELRPGRAETLEMRVTQNLTPVQWTILREAKRKKRRSNGCWSPWWWAATGMHRMNAAPFASTKCTAATRSS